MNFRWPVATLLATAGTLLAATVPYVYLCDKDSGFLTDPNTHKRVGYITALKGFGVAAFRPDLSLSVPFMPSHGLMTMMRAPGLPPVTSVIGVLDKFEWDGGPGSPLKLEFYVSQETATMLKSLQQSTLTTATISSLAWWIGDYDLEAKKWFEEAYPQSSATVSGMITGKDLPALNVDLNGVPVKDGIDVLVYKVSMSVSPAANQTYSLLFANSSTKAVVTTWGVKTGIILNR